MSPTLWVSVPPRRARRTAQLVCFPSARLHGGLQMPSWPSARTGSSCAVPREFLGPLLSQLRGERPASEVAVGSGRCQERRAWARKGPRPFPRHWTSEPACWAVNGQEGKSWCGDKVDQ